MRNVTTGRVCSTAIPLTCVLAMVLSHPALAGSANPPSVTFGNVPVNTSVNQNVAITIDAGYYIANVQGSGASAPFGFSYGTCVGIGGFTGPGTCTAIASFSPASGIIGAQTGTTSVLECPVGGGIGFCPSITYSVGGTGVYMLAANPPFVDFGNVQVNTTASRNVAITIDAGYHFAGVLGVPGGAFTYDPGNCAGVGIGFQGPGACVTHVGFTPGGLGADQSSRDVYECADAGMFCFVQTLHIDFMGNGVAIGPPNLLGAASRKVHGGTGTFNLPLSAGP